MRPSFLRKKDGATAMTFAITLPVAALAAGVAVDTGKLIAARDNLQQVTDSASLAVARTNLVNEVDLKNFIRSHIRSTTNENLTNIDVGNVTIDRDNNIFVTTKGVYSTNFMGLAGVNTINVTVNTKVVRTFPGRVEVALVLDNTYSMSLATPGGGTRMAALKNASEVLINELEADPSGKVWMAVVPYADYVNVGTGNRGQPWVSVPLDVVDRGTCTINTTRQNCRGGVVRQKTCTRITDGVPVTYSCPEVLVPQTCTTVSVRPYETCVGGTTSKWFGCVGSRTVGTLRLTDDQTLVPYPGRMGTRRLCPGPILPLTNDFDRVRSSIAAMSPSSTLYEPLTYLPAGLVWGLNVLSPSAPFTQGRSYDRENIEPRKVMVFMTDGENTLRFNGTTGSHDPLNGDPAIAATQRTTTDNETQILCTNAKNRGIEIFTVGLGVTDPQALNLLKSCASDLNHHFDATDTASIEAAFRAIAANLRAIRLAS